jgi:hypothetical protein
MTTETTNTTTPGPWKVSMPHITTEGALGYMATMSNYPEALADAHLMALAPELLAALEMISWSVSHGHYDDINVNGISELISRARGD